MVVSPVRTRRESTIREATGVAPGPRFSPPAAPSRDVSATSFVEVCAGTCAGASTCTQRAEMLARRDRQLAGLRAPVTPTLRHVDIAYEGHTTRPTPAAPAQPRLVANLDF